MKTLQAMLSGKRSVSFKVQKKDTMVDFVEMTQRAEQPPERVRDWGYGSRVGTQDRLQSPNWYNTNYPVTSQLGVLIPEEEMKKIDIEAFLKQVRGGEAAAAIGN